MLGRATLQCRHCAQFAGGGGVILQSSKGAKEAMREAQEEAPPRVGGSQEEEHLFDAFSFMTKKRFFPKWSDFVCLCWCCTGQQQQRHAKQQPLLLLLPCKSTFRKSLGKADQEDCRALPGYPLSAGTAVFLLTVFLGAE
eukprot:GHVS01021629.1.p2 GENE.GHVS01021629.1~~GHVS01021629.1.p2  ORF type:complete len:140 (-),score=30.75 GHVS01021629.1:144-563(-)